MLKAKWGGGALTLPSGGPRTSLHNPQTPESYFCHCGLCGPAQSKRSQLEGEAQCTSEALLQAVPWRSQGLGHDTLCKSVTLNKMNGVIRSDVMNKLTGVLIGILSPCIFCQTSLRPQSAAQTRWFQGSYASPLHCGATPNRGNRGLPFIKSGQRSPAGLGTRNLSSNRLGR